MAELTVRQQIYELLRGKRVTAKEISQAVSIREKEVVGHLLHIAKSHKGEFHVEHPLCLGCGFTFKKRERLSTPGRCPVCKEERISETRYGIGERDSGVE